MVSVVQSGMDEAWGTVANTFELTWEIENPFKVMPHDGDAHNNSSGRVKTRTEKFARKILAHI